MVARRKHDKYRIPYDEVVNYRMWLKRRPRKQFQRGKASVLAGLITLKYRMIRPRRGVGAIWQRGCVA